MPTIDFITELFCRVAEQLVQADKVHPLFRQTEQAEIVTTVTTSKPVEHGLPGHGWTLKKLRRWVADKIGKPVSHTRLRTILKAAG